MGASTAPAAIRRRGSGTENNLPHTRMIPVDSMDWAKIDGIQIFDIFAPEAETVLEKAIQGGGRAVQGRPDADALLYRQRIRVRISSIRTFAKLKASKAAIKGRLVETLRAEKYGTIEAFNSSWRTSFTSFDQWKEAELTLATLAIVAGYGRLSCDYYVDTFYGTMTNLIRQVATPNASGARRPLDYDAGSIRSKFRTPLAEIAGKYFDVISINYYSYKLETDLLRDVYEKSGREAAADERIRIAGRRSKAEGAAAEFGNQSVRKRHAVPELRGRSRQPRLRRRGAAFVQLRGSGGSGRYWQTYWGERYNSGLVNVGRPSVQGISRRALWIRTTIL
ncbi:hypothetical protein ACFSL6_25945 [Paenibacillus thailandensis]|uniref:hypothetical protein n=1 Tax=Paenibacillus thailandensis TaxID=393250 RepID=UPI003630788E